MQKTIYIEYWTKKIPLHISPSTDPEDIWEKNIIHIECEPAWLNQEIVNEDLVWFIDLIPELIEKKLAREKKFDILQIRLSGNERLAIEKLAKKNGYRNVSAYVRARTLQTA